MNLKNYSFLLLIITFLSTCRLDQSATSAALVAQTSVQDFCQVDQDRPSVGHPLQIEMPKLASEIYSGEVPTFYELNGVNVNIGNQWHFDKMEHLGETFSHARTFHFMNKDYWDDGLGQANGNDPKTLRKHTPKDIHRLKLLVDAAGVPIQRGAWQKGDRIITFDPKTETLVEEPLTADFLNVYENYLNQNWIYQKSVSDQFKGNLQITLTVVNFNFPKGEAEAHNFPNQWYLEKDWGDARLTAKAYAMLFARAYGPKDGSYQVCKTLEIGNEPWGLPAKTYQTIVDGFVEGFEAYYGNDFRIQLIPAAFQGNHFENAKPANWIRANWKDYLGTRLNTTNRCKLAGVNIHNYPNDIKDRPITGWFKERLIATPEEESSAFLYGRNAWKWLQMNMPPDARNLYASEYGWDTRDDCTEKVNATAVGEVAQGIYVARALLLHARMGVWRANVFELMDDKGQNPCQFAYHSSGFYTEGNGQVSAKASVNILHDFIKAIGDYKLKEVLVESSDYYLFSLSNGQETIKVGWLPLNVNNKSLDEVQRMKKKIKHNGRTYDLSPIPKVFK